MVFEIWIIGFMFTLGLLFDDGDKWYHLVLGFFVWPLLLGIFIRKVIEK